MGTLKALKEEIKISKMISAGLVKEVDKLVNSIESEINEEGS